MKRKVAIYARVSTEHEAQLSALENQVQTVAYVTVDKEKRSGSLTRLPERNELTSEINEAAIVEFYNRKL